MKIHLLSDLHLEFGKAAQGWKIPTTDADVIVLAGDIFVGKRGVQWAISEAIRLGKPVIYVMGNHEYYRYEMTSLLEKVRSIADSCDKFHLLESSSVTIDGVRFLGCTLWTDYDCDPQSSQASSMEEAGRRLNDHALITLNNQRFMPADALALHQQSKRWLIDELDSSFDGQTVVVTHHAPSLSAQHPKFPISALTGAFLSNMSPLFGKKITAWLFGHTHYSVDTFVNGTHLVSNQAGYPGEDCGEYKQDKIIDTLN